MNKETVASFLLAVCVVGGSLFLATKYSGALPLAAAAVPAPDNAPASTPSTASPSTASQAPAEPAQTRVAEAQQAQQAQVDATDDEAAVVPEGKPRCKAIGHQIGSIDAALLSPLSPAVQDFYHKQRQSLQDEKATLAC